jgi:hypothetical protein
MRDLIKGKIVMKTNIAIIRSRIMEMSINPDEFDRMLIKTNAVLSGSFLVQCIVGDKWKDSDIDVFGQIKQKYILTKRNQIVPQPCQMNITTPVHKLEMIPWSYMHRKSSTDSKPVNNSKSKLLRFPKASGGFNNEYNGIIGFAYSRKYIIPTSNSSVIFNFVGTRINAKKYIQKCFDISICKNYYDGKKLTIMHPYHVLCRIGKLVRFTNSMNFVHKIPKKVYDRIYKYKSRGFHIRRHSEYNGLEEMIKFRKYDYYISRELPRNTRFKYQFPEKFDEDNFTKLKLECKSINVIKIKTEKYRYIIIRFNRVNDISIYILYNISGDDGNVLKYAVNGLKNIMKKFWYFESMNPSIEVNFDYYAPEMCGRVCNPESLKMMIVG